MAKVGRHKVSKKLRDEYAKLAAQDVSTSRSPTPTPRPARSTTSCRRPTSSPTVSYLVKLHNNDADYYPDDIDHFGNRRVRSVGELIQNQVRVGLSRMERVVRERMTTQDVEAITPQTLINIRPVVAAIKEFFGSSQLSQFMDQTNPLAGLTHKRRLSALGPGGLSRERAGFEVRDVHPSHYGRMCPIETPEGPNIGLIGYLVELRADQPVRLHRDAVPQGRRTASRTDEHRVPRRRRRGPLRHRAGRTPSIDDKGRFLDERVLVRARRGERRVRRPRHEVDYMDVSPKQIVSVATALIPFLEHDDANRALMGANMQRQAVPLLRPTAPFIGTGRRGPCARATPATLILAEGDGTRRRRHRRRRSSSSTRRPRRARPRYRLSKFRRSNQGTCINQKPLVDIGDVVKEGDVLADGPSTHEGELALGKNLLVAFMPWKGHNYEDAIVISERLVKDDVLTSIHIEEHEIDARDTKLGAEEITRDIPNLSEDILKDLDERGIIRIGAEVGPGDILVGKVTPKGETELTPEERLLRAIFGEKAREVRDTSLKVPHGETGKVIDVRVFSREDGHELPPGVNQLVRVYVGQKRKISEGDKLAGRHGNKGVISKILPGRGHAVPRRRHARRHRAQPARCPEPHERRPGARGAPRLRGPSRLGGPARRRRSARARRARSPSPRCGSTRPVFDGAHWDEVEQSGPEGTIEQLFETMHPDGADGAAARRQRRQGDALRRPHRRGLRPPGDRRATSTS